MRITVYPSAIEGAVEAPSSKSMSQRAIAAALLVQGETIIQNISHCDDSLAALKMAANMGAIMVETPTGIKIKTHNALQGNTLHCGESGLAMRMFAPIAALQKNSFVFTGIGSLLNRPVYMIGEALQQLGAEFSSNGGVLPFQLQGPLHGGKITIDGSISSQLLSGLLMALPTLEQDSEIGVKKLKSKPYISMTLQLMENFGVSIHNHNFETFIIQGRQKYNPCTYHVEGDWSGAAFLLVAGAIGGNVVMKDLLRSSLQADRAILDVLKQVGVNCVLTDEGVEITKSELASFDFDATHCPDLFPPLVALAAYCKGKSHIKGVERLIHKESNRAHAILQEMSKLGIKISLLDDEMHIIGGMVKGNTVNSHNDHRIAMMLSVAAIAAEGPVTIDDAACVSKSYPDFYSHLSQLGAKVKQDEASGTGNQF